MPKNLLMNIKYDINSMSYKQLKEAVQKLMNLQKRKNIFKKKQKN